jgi:hypothetical protein
MAKDLYNYDKIPAYDAGRYLRLGRSEALGKKASSLDDQLQEFRVVGNADTELVLRILRSIGAGEAMRCFIPAYGLGLYLHGKSIWWCSICWQCNWIQIGGNLYPFDGKCKAAASMLGMFTSAFQTSTT